MGSSTDTVRLVSINGSNVRNGAKRDLIVDHNEAESVFVRQSYDVIVNGLPFECGMRMLCPPHPTSSVLQRVVSEFLQLHKNYMTESLQGLQLSKENIITVYSGIANEIVNAENNTSLSWGRVVLLYALAKQMAQLCFNKPSPQILTFVVYVGNFVDSKTSHWIEAQGGWESIYDVFGKDTNGQRHIVSDYLHTIAGYLVKAFDYSSSIPCLLLKQ